MYLKSPTFGPFNKLLKGDQGKRYPYLNKNYIQTPQLFPPAVNEIFFLVAKALSFELAQMGPKQMIMM